MNTMSDYKLHGDGELVLPATAERVVRALELAQPENEGVQIFVNGRWRRVLSAKVYTPPLPEEIDAAVADIAEARLRGEYERIADLAGVLASTAHDLARRQATEVVVSTGTVRLRLEPQARVAVGKSGAMRHFEKVATA